MIAAAFQLLRDLPRAFATMDARQWTRFQQILFPKGISFDRDSGFGTAEVGLIYAISDVKSGGDSAVVDRAGLEPATPAMQTQCSTK